MGKSSGQPPPILRTALLKELVIHCFPFSGEFRIACSDSVRMKSSSSIDSVVLYALSLWGRAAIRHEKEGQRVMIRILFQAIVLLTAVHPVVCLAQSEQKLPANDIVSFDIEYKVHSESHFYAGEKTRLNIKHHKKSLSWNVTDKSLITEVYSRDGKEIKHSENEKPLERIEEKSFTVKRRVQTEGGSAESHVEVRMIVADTGILIDGHQKIMLSPKASSANIASSMAETDVTFDVRVREESTVRITGCDVFEKDNFQGLPEFQDNGATCSFKIPYETIGSGPESFVPFLDLKGQPFSKLLIFVATLRDKASTVRKKNSAVTLEKPFTITVTKKCATTEPTVAVSPGKLQQCTQEIVNAVNGNFSGLKKIGGLVEKCQDPWDNRDSKTWFQATGGTCTSEDYKKDFGQPDPDKPGHCLGKGSIWKKEKMFEKTAGTCKNEYGYSNSVSKHAFGYAVDLYIWWFPPKEKRKTPVPVGCALEAGDRIAEWARTNRARYNIKTIIWNKKIVSAKKNWQERAYCKPGKKKCKPHYDHVHVDCVNPIQGK